MPAGIEVPAGTADTTRRERAMEGNPPKPSLCPSADPEMGEAKVFGVALRTPDGALRLGYLTEAQPATPDILAASGAAKPAEVMRIAAPCMHSGCVHFSGATCRLAARITAMLDPVVSDLPRCAIRPTCRWFQQEGRAACLRCPQVIRELGEADDKYHAAVAAPGLP